MTGRSWIILALGAWMCEGCATLSEVRNRFGRVDAPPPVVEEIAAAPSVNGPAAAAPAERSPVYQSQSIQRKEGVEASKPDGWSVPEAPIRFDEPPRSPAPELKTNASPDLGLVRSEADSDVDTPPVVRTESWSNPSPSTTPPPAPLVSTPESVSSSGYQSRSLGEVGMPDITDRFSPIVSEPAPAPTIESPQLAQVGAPWASDAPSSPILEASPSEASTAPLGGVYPPPAAASAYPPAAAYPSSTGAQGQASPSTGPQGVVRGGQPAPTLALTTLDGRTFNLESHRGRVVVLDFWYSTCGPCMRSMGTLEQLRNQYTENQLVILGMNADRNQRDAVAAIKRGNHNWPQVFTPSQRPDPRRVFSVSQYPTFVVVDQVGNIQYRGSSVQHAAAKVNELVAAPSIGPGGQIGAGYLAGLN